MDTLYLSTGWWFLPSTAWLEDFFGKQRVRLPETKHLKNMGTSSIGKCSTEKLPLGPKWTFLTVQYRPILKKNSGGMVDQIEILLMDEILHRLGWLKPYK